MKALKILVLCTFSFAWSLDIYIDGPLQLLDCAGGNHDDQQRPESTTTSLFTEATLEPKVVNCPASEGYYRPPNSTQCFKFDNFMRSWNEAQQWCISQGMVLPKPHEDIIPALQKYLKPRRKYCNVHLGAQGTAQDVLVWEQDNSILPQDHPLWQDGQPEYSGEGGCVAMYTWQSPPYYVGSCDWLIYTLCEKVA